MLRALGIRLQVHGTVPQTGMLTGNHLGYLDIITFGTLTGGIFVAKEELKTWPLLGAIMRGGGSIFINRKSVRSAATSSRQIAAALDRKMPVTLFPEGTSSDGTTVLPVHSPLFQAAAQRQTPVWPVAIAYAANGSVDGTEESVCYWGDMTFGSHVLRLLSLRRVDAAMHVAAEPIVKTDRREIAAAVQAELIRLHKNARQSVASVDVDRAVPVQQTAAA